MNEKEFQELKYGCPIYDCTWDATCPATKKHCAYNNCPFVYWLSNFNKKEGE